VTRKKRTQAVISSFGEMGRRKKRKWLAESYRVTRTHAGREKKNPLRSIFRVKNLNASLHQKGERVRDTASHF